MNPGAEAFLGNIMAEAESLEEILVRLVSVFRVRQRSPHSAFERHRKARMSRPYQFEQVGLHEFLVLSRQLLGHVEITNA